MLPRLVPNPLETLPSWPAVHEPSVLEFLVLTVAIPAGIAVVFVALVLAPGWWRKHRTDA